MTSEKKILETMTAGALMDQQYLPRSMVVDGFLTAGTYILAGAPKAGKSFMMAQLCWCVSEGKPFLGCRTRQSDVLYMALEDMPQRLQSRLAEMFGTEWEGEHLHLAFRNELSCGELLNEIQDFVLLNPDTRLIVIDTLQRIRDGDGGQYSYISDYETVKPFKELTDFRDLALILVHHTRKNTEDKNPFNQISGTNGLLGAADGAYLLHDLNGEPILDYTGRDLPSQRYFLRFQKDCCLWELVKTGAAALTPKPEPLLELIDHFLESEWTGTASELLEQLQKDTPDVASAPNNLTKKLNTLTARLEEERGIRYRTVRRNKERMIILKRLPKKE